VLILLRCDIVDEKAIRLTTYDTPVLNTYPFLFVSQLPVANDVLIPNVIVFYLKTVLYLIYFL